MPAQQSRSWLCTLHIQEQPVDTLGALPTGGKILYAVGQLERAPTTEQLHWQFFLYFRKKLTLGGVKEAIGDWLGETIPECATTVHCDRCRGTFEQCVGYVTKDDTRVGLGFEYGERPVVVRSGRELLAEFRRGRTIDPTDPVWDDVLLRFSKPRLDELRNLVHPRKRDPAIPIVFQVHIGEPGTGKSRGVFSSFPEAYIKPPGKWWPDYNAETHVIMDDFDGSFLPFGLFKLVFDRYPLRVEVKLSYTQLLATHFYITTNVYPSHWWSNFTVGTDGRDAIWRRITDVFVYTDVNEEPVRWDPQAYRASKFFALEPQDPKGEKEKNQ